MWAYILFGAVMLLMVILAVGPFLLPLLPDKRDKDE